MKEIEIRSYPTPLNSEGRRLSGYAARFDTLSRVLVGQNKVFRELLTPGIFARSITNPVLGSIMALWNHGADGRPPLARTPTTLRLWEDAEGLAFEFELPESAEDIREAVKRGDVWGMSFGFNRVTARYEDSRANGELHRKLVYLDLFEISLTDIPAYPSTSVHVRNQSELAPVFSPSRITRAKQLLELASRVDG